jgi:hypothetical protein
MRNNFFNILHSPKSPERKTTVCLRIKAKNIIFGECHVIFSAINTDVVRVIGHRAVETFSVVRADLAIAESGAIFTH